MRGACASRAGSTVFNDTQVWYVIGRATAFILARLHIVRWGACADMPLVELTLRAALFVLVELGFACSCIILIIMLDERFGVKCAAAMRA